MSNKKNNGDYKNIDFVDNDFFSNDDFTADKDKKIITEQYTLDSYNEEMSRKPIQAMFSNITEYKEPVSVDETKPQYGYNGTNRHNTISSKSKKPVKNKKTDDNGNVDYTYQSFDYDKLNNDVQNGYKYGDSKKDFRNTSFSTQKIQAERDARADVERNKEILKQLEKEQAINDRQERHQKINQKFNSYKTVQEVQQSFEDDEIIRPRQKQQNKVNKKRQQIMMLRLCTTGFIFILILCLFINIYSNRKMNSQILELQTENERLTEENLQVITLQNEVNILNDELTKLKAGVDTTTDTSTEQSTQDQSTTESSSQQYTVKSGDSLAGISQQFYGDPNKYNEIVQANNLTSTNLTVGQTLLIP